MTKRATLSTQAARELRGDLKGALTGFASGACWGVVTQIFQ